MPPPAAMTAMLLMSCSAPAGTPRTAAEPAVVVHGADGRTVRVRVEVVRTPADLARGLMHREKLDADAGMLFLFDRTQVLSFWMKNTLIPLDMIFIGEDRRVVGVVHNAEPLTTVQRSVGAPSRYVLEVNAGFAAQRGVGPGSLVEFVDVP